MDADIQAENKKINKLSRQAATEGDWPLWDLCHLALPGSTFLMGTGLQEEAQATLCALSRKEVLRIAEERKDVAETEATRLEGLRREAYVAGDEVQGDLASLALGHEILGEVGEEVATMIQAWALEKCRKALKEGKG